MPSPFPAALAAIYCQARVEGTAWILTRLGHRGNLRPAPRRQAFHRTSFWDVNRSGGGVMMDMGCHAIAFFRWLLDRQAIKSVYAQLSTQVHTDKTIGDDNGILILEFAAYQSAGSGCQVSLPFATDAAKPIDLWKPPAT